MKCNVCQDDMISSKSGWMCLNCGNSVANKPSDTPILFGDTGRQVDAMANGADTAGSDVAVATAASSVSVAPAPEAAAPAPAQPLDAESVAEVVQSQTPTEPSLSGATDAGTTGSVDSMPTGTTGEPTVTITVNAPNLSAAEASPDVQPVPDPDVVAEPEPLNEQAAGADSAPSTVATYPVQAVVQQEANEPESPTVLEAPVTNDVVGAPAEPAVVATEPSSPAVNEIKSTVTEVTISPSVPVAGGVAESVPAAEAPAPVAAANQIERPSVMAPEAVAVESGFASVQPSPEVATAETIAPEAVAATVQAPDAQAAPVPEPATSVAEVKPMATDGVIDGVGAGRGNAVLNLKPATEALARPADRTAPSVDAIGRMPVAAGDLHAASLSVPAPGPAVGAPEAASAEPASALAPAETGSFAAPAPQPVVATSGEPAAQTAPLATREDALKHALGEDVASQVAAVETNAAGASANPDFWNQIAVPPKPKAAPIAVPKQAVAGVVTGVALIAVVFGGFYFFNHTNGTTTAVLPEGSTGYSGTSLARVTSGGADAGTKADVATPVPSPTPSTLTTLPGGQTDATRMAGRDTRRKADVAAYAAAYKAKATNGYYPTNAPAVTVDAADPSTAKPYAIQPADVTATGQIRYWAGGQCAGKGVTPGASSTRYLALQTKLEDGSVYCLDVK